MKKIVRRIFNSILVIIAVFNLTGPASEDMVMVHAKTISEVQSEIDNTQNELNEIYAKIDSLTDEQDLVQEEIEDLNSEIINAMTSISMKEDEIAEKEAEISDKTEAIEETEQEYELAKEKAEKQYNDMVIQIRYMYEQGDISYAGLLFSGDGLSDALNRMDYAESIYEYSRARLEELETLRDKVLELWNRLENEKTQLEEDKQNLEESKVYLEDLKANLDSNLAKKKQDSANYDAEIK
ncbi:MAG: hypothetical protein LUG83_06140, partial [Lachnospiraceae bacterium]|nr:hypothetical protein [Lachnospiraceae bacterium]